MPLKVHNFMLKRSRKLFFSNRLTPCGIAAYITTSYISSIVWSTILFLISNKLGWKFSSFCAFQHATQSLSFCVSKSWSFISSCSRTHTKSELYVTSCLENRNDLSHACCISKCLRKKKTSREQKFPIHNVHTKGALHTFRMQNSEQYSEFTKKCAIQVVSKMKKVLYCYCLRKCKKKWICKLDWNENAKMFFVEHKRTSSSSLTISQ